MIELLAALAVETSAAAQTTPACAAWGPILNNGLTVERLCLDTDGAKVPPLVVTRETVVRSAPGRWAGLVIDASTLKLPNAPVGEGGELFRIKVRQGHAARLTRKFVGRGMGGASLKVGDLVYGTSVRHTFMMQTPGYPARELLTETMYLYCAPVRLGAKSPEIDRGMCFIEAREVKKLGIIPGVNVSITNFYSLALSGKGDAAHAPRSMSMDATMGVLKPTVEAFDGPYPEAFDLVVTWLQRDGRRVLLAQVVDTAGRSTVAEAEMGDTVTKVFGGELTVVSSPGGLVPSFQKPIVDGAILDFRGSEAAP